MPVAGTLFALDDIGLPSVIGGEAADFRDFVLPRALEDCPSLLEAMFASPVVTFSYLLLRVTPTSSTSERVIVGSPQSC